MGETVGFRSVFALLHPELIKRDALMFRRVGIIGCDRVSEAMPGIFKQNFPEIPWLVEQGVLFEPRLDAPLTAELLDDETQNSINSIRDFMMKHRDYFKELFDDEKKLISNINQLVEEEIGIRTEQGSFQASKRILYGLISAEVFLRPLSSYYRNVMHIDAIPVASGKLPELPQQTGSVEEVVKVVINHLPIPDDSTSWEQIMDFRNDLDTQGKFLGLRNWMNDVARAKLTPLEVEQKLEWMIHDYQEHMNLHRMKANTGTLETILVSLADRKFGDIVKGLFSVKHKQIALLEAEAKSPGREIAIISKAQETFR